MYRPSEVAFSSIDRLVHFSREHHDQSYKGRGSGHSDQVEQFADWERVLLGEECQ